MVTLQIKDEAIRNLMTSMIDAVNYDELSKRFVRIFTVYFNCELCSIWRRVEKEGEDVLELSASIGIRKKHGDLFPTYDLNWQAKTNEEIDGVTAWIAIRREICLANSYFEFKNDKTKPWYNTHRGKWDAFQFADNDKFRNFLGLPIVSNSPNREKKIIAVIKLEASFKPNGFDLEDIEMAENLMPFAAIAFETLTIREIREQHRQQIIRKLTSGLLHQDSTTFNQELVTRTAELLRADKCSLWLVNDNRKRLILGANYGVIKKEPIPEYELNWKVESDHDIHGLTPWVAIRKRPFFAETYDDLKTHPAWRGKWDLAQWNDDAQNEFGCLYAVPLVNIYEEVLGVLKIENHSTKVKFDAVDIATFDLMADFIALAIEFNSRLRSDIVYDFFHLLKQPVSNTIMAYRDLKNELSKEIPRQERIEARLSILARNLQTVNVWIKNVYGMAATKEIPGEIPYKISIMQLLQEAILNMQNLYPEFHCDLKNAHEYSIYLTSLQRKKLDAILYNIFDNSFKYTREPREILAKTHTDENNLIITIQDNGDGIKPEDLPNIFKPYFTKGNAGHTEAMGLGLSTVDKLISEFGWDKKVESKLNFGTTFSIMVPLKQTKGV